MFLLASSTTPPKFQTSPAPAPLFQVFFSLLKTTSDHMSSTEPTKLKTSSASPSSTSEAVFRTSMNSECKKDRFENSQKQPSRGVIKKRCSQNMQQIYRRTPMPEYDFNEVALQFY